MPTDPLPRDPDANSFPEAVLTALREIVPRAEALRLALEPLKLNEELFQVKTGLMRGSGTLLRHALHALKRPQRRRPSLDSGPPAAPHGEGGPSAARRGDRARAGAP